MKYKFIKYNDIFIYLCYIIHNNVKKKGFFQMKKYARLVPAIALLLSMITLFSGCSLVELTRSIVRKDGNVSAEIKDDNTKPSGDDTVGEDVTNSAVLNGTLPSESTTVPSSSTSTTKQSNNKKPNANTQATQGTTHIKETPVKDIQDLLFATDPNKASDILIAAGFAYDETQGIFYTPLYPWQRYFGYNVGFDMAAPLTGMIFDTERLEFTYGGKEWMIQLWKGQYGITAGAEVGLYTRAPGTAIQYDCADDEDLIKMQFDFYNQGKYVFSRGPEKHWWLTGFKVFHVGIPFTISMDITLKFTDNAMASAFLTSLKKAQTGSNALLNPIKYKRSGSTIRFIWGSMPKDLRKGDI
jgi:hypothetical protein